jgi:precorrin-2 methylase
MLTIPKCEPGGEKVAAKLVADAVKKRADAEECVAPFDEDQHEEINY